MKITLHALGSDLLRMDIQISIVLGLVILTGIRTALMLRTSDYDKTERHLVIVLTMACATILGFLYLFLVRH